MTLKNSCHSYMRCLSQAGCCLSHPCVVRDTAFTTCVTHLDKIVLESNHVHEFDPLDEFNQVVSNRESRIVHTVQYQVSFSILDFILRRVHRFIRKSFTHNISTNGAMLRVRKATKIPVPGYCYIETVLGKNST